jgi:hypothetical protein
MEYSDREFAKLSLPIHEHHKDADIFRLFPILTKYEVFRRPLDGLNINHVIRYIVYCFDRYSPLHDIIDIFERRVQAARMAGFNMLESERFDAHVNQMLLSRNSNVNDMIIQYSIAYGGEDWTTYNVYQEALRQSLENLQNKDQDNEGNRNKMITNITSLRTEIRSLKETLFRFKDDPWIEDSLYKFMQYSQLKLVPEDYAKLHSGFEELVEGRPDKVYVGQHQNQ